MKKFILVGLGLLVVAGSVWIGRTPYRNWKQKHFLAQARTYLAKSDFRNAVMSARKTLEANPSNLEASRIMAKVTEQFHFPEAIFWRHHILDLEPGVVRNRLDLARTAIMLGSTREADQALHGVKESDRNRPDFHEIAAMLYAAENNIPAAETEATAAVKLDPANKSLQLNLAILDVQSKNKQLVAAAKRALEQLSVDPAFRREALRQLALAAKRDGDFARAENYTRQLQLEKPLMMDDELLNLTILREGKSKSFTANLATMEKEVCNNPQQINVLSGWLLSQGMSDESLRWLASLPDKIRNEQAVVVATADCCAARNDWTRMQSLLSNRNWAESDFLRLALMARALRGQKDELGAQSNWHAAVTAASGHRLPLVSLVRLASAWGWEKEEEEAVWLLIERFPGERWALEMLDRMYAGNGNTRGLQKVYASLMKIDPANVMARNNFAAISFLLGLQLTEAHQIAKDNYARYPQDAIMTSTYAFSLHLQGRTHEAAKLLDKLPEDKRRLPAVAPYCGVILAASGQSAKAKAYLDLAAQSKLLPEEKALVVAALNSFSQGSRPSSRH